MPVEVWNSSSSPAWKSSSRGNVARILRSALPECESRRRPDRLHHRIEFLAHQRNFPRPPRVGAGSEQSEETLFNDRLALVVELEHADVIHVTGSMHAGARIRLGENDRVERSGLRQLRRGQRLQRTRCHRTLAAAENTETGSIHGDQHFFAVLHADFVFAITEKGEIVVGRPAQEMLRLGDAFRTDRHVLFRHVVGDGDHLVAHRAPVAHALRHVFQRRGNRLFHTRTLRDFGDAIHLEMHQRFGFAFAAFRTQAQDVSTRIALDAVDRMHHRVHLQSGMRQRDTDRIDEKRHVVGDDVDRCAVRIVAVVRGRGIEHAHARRAGFAHTHEIEQSGDNRGPRLGRPRSDVFFAHALEKMTREDLRLSALRGAETLFELLQNRIDRAGGGNRLSIHEKGSEKRVFEGR